MLLARMDDLGRVAWLVLTLGAFWFAWPLGLAVLAFLAGSGRLRAFRGGFANDAGRLFGRCGPAGRDWTRGASGGRPFGGSVWSSMGFGGSGNTAFDAYRRAEIDRLEEEQREFQAFITRLRQARDKAEFDQFMAERRRDGARSANADDTGALQT